MQYLNQVEIGKINGGFWPQFIMVLGVFAAPGLFARRINQYGNWGKDASQNYWDNQYPYDPNSNACYGSNC